MPATADQLNYKAREGYVGVEELNEFCRVQNPNLCSIQWRVVTRYHERDGVEFSYPQLEAKVLPVGNT